MNVHLVALPQQQKKENDKETDPFDSENTVSEENQWDRRNEGSLVSREVIADSIEVVTFGERMDGLLQ
ncbi:MAG: hypothetical protein CM1200mP15_12980 [Dehalococcoidia bacterium]|nr:MAG: hypothetical protein CM1200mP15_12980 [Dehalococcoidia bacterium]